MKIDPACLDDSRVSLTFVSVQPNHDAWVKTFFQGAGTIYQGIWAGDGGYIWLHLTNGGSAVIANNDPNREAVIALATSALLASHQIIVRYAADGVDCTSAGRTDFVGMYLL